MKDNNTDDGKTEMKYIHRSHHGVLGGVILITIGIVFLLNNFGLLPWTIWSVIWKFWPLFLILAGLEILFGGSWLAEFAVGLITITIVGFILTQIIASNNVQFRSWIQSHIKWLPLNSKMFLIPKNNPRNQFLQDNQGFEN